MSSNSPDRSETLLGNRGRRRRGEGVSKGESKPGPQCLGGVLTRARGIEGEMLASRLTCLRRAILFDVGVETSIVMIVVGEISYCMRERVEIDMAEVCVTVFVCCGAMWSPRGGWMGR